MYNNTHPSTPNTPVSPTKDASFPQLGSLRTVGDERSDHTEYSENGLKPIKEDILPLILAVIVIILGLISCVVPYFLLQANEIIVARNELATLMNQGLVNLQKATETVGNTLQSFRAFYQFSSVQPTYLNQMVPYCYSTASGQFPDNVNTMVYAQMVLNQDRDAFVAKIRSMASEIPLYQGFNITGRNANNQVVPMWTEPLYAVAIHVAPLKGAQIILGANLMANPSRALDILNANLTMNITATPTFTTLRDGSYRPGVSLYSAVTDLNGTWVGIASVTIRIDELMVNAIPELASRGVYAAVFDLNYTSSDSTQGFIVTTQPGPNNTTLITAAQNNITMQQAEFLETGTFSFFDRLYSVVLIPTSSYINSFSSIQKWVPVIVSSILTLILVGICISIMFIRRMNKARKQRAESKNQMKKLRENQDNLRKLLNRIASQEHKARATINAIRDVVIVINRAGRILHTNKAFDKLFVYSEMELERGIQISSLFPDLGEDFFTAVTVDSVQTVARSRFGISFPMEIVVECLDMVDNSIISSVDSVSKAAEENENDVEAYVIVGHRKSQKSSDKLDQKEENIDSIMHSFDDRFPNEEFQNELLKFCVQNHTDESIQFLIKVRQYKRTKDIEQRIALQKSISDIFLKSGSPKQLNLPNDVMQLELMKISKNFGDPNVFKNIEEFVKRIVLTDIYPRFLAAQGHNVMETKSDVANNKHVI